MGHVLTKSETAWLEQQEAIRIGFIKGFLRDLDLLNYHPEYRSDFFNETVINKEIMHQYRLIGALRKEMQRREIP